MKGHKSGVRHPSHAGIVNWSVKTAHPLALNPKPSKPYVPWLSSPLHLDTIDGRDALPRGRITSCDGRVLLRLCECSDLKARSQDPNTTSTLKGLKCRSTSTSTSTGTGTGGNRSRSSIANSGGGGGGGGGGCCCCSSSPLNVGWHLFILFATGCLALGFEASAGFKKEPKRAGRGLNRARLKGPRWSGRIRCYSAGLGEFAV